MTYLLHQHAVLGSSHHRRRLRFPSYKPFNCRDLSLHKSHYHSRQTPVAFCRTPDFFFQRNQWYNWCTFFAGTSKTGKKTQQFGIADRRSRPREADTLPHVGTTQAYVSPVARCHYTTRDYVSSTARCHYATKWSVSSIARCYYRCTTNIMTHTVML